MSKTKVMLIRSQSSQATLAFPKQFAEFVTNVSTSAGNQQPAGASKSSGGTIAESANQAKGTGR